MQIRVQLGVTFLNHRTEFIAECFNIMVIRLSQIRTASACFYYVFRLNELLQERSKRQETVSESSVWTLSVLSDRNVQNSFLEP